MAGAGRDASEDERSLRIPENSVSSTGLYLTSSVPQPLATRPGEVSKDTA